MDRRLPNILRTTGTRKMSTTHQQTVYINRNEQSFETTVPRPASKDYEHFVQAHSATGQANLPAK